MDTRCLFLLSWVVLGWLPHAAAADDEVKSTTDFVGTCTKGTFVDRDVTGGCYGRVFNTVYKSGRVDFTFFVGGQAYFKFSGSKDSMPIKDHRAVEIDTIRVHTPDSDLGDKPADGICAVDGDISETAVVACKVVAAGHIIEFIVDSTQPASYHEASEAPPGGGKSPPRYLDNLQSVCTKAVLNGVDKTSACLGVMHTAFTNGRADFMLGMDGHLVAFSGDQERGSGTGHYILYVNRLYYDKESTPAKGKCELNGDYLGKSTVICDAVAVTVDAPFSAHAEFDVSGVQHKDYSGK